MRLEEAREVVAPHLISEAMDDYLFHTTKVRHVKSIASSGKLLASRRGCCKFISLSEEPLHGLDFGKVILVLSRDKVKRSVQKVSYTRAWVSKNMKKAGYISEMDPYRKPMDAYDDPFAEFVDDFREMRNEREWITRREGAGLSLKRGALVAVLCADQCNKAHMEMLRDAFQGLVPRSNVMTLAKGKAKLKGAGFAKAAPKARAKSKAAPSARAADVSGQSGMGRLRGMTAAQQQAILRRALGL